MVRIMSEQHRICANCSPYITKMEKLLYLKNVYMCSICGGFEYIVPGQRTSWELEEVEEENSEKEDYY